MLQLCTKILSRSMREFIHSEQTAVLQVIAQMASDVEGHRQVLAKQHIVLSFQLFRGVRGDC